MAGTEAPDWAALRRVADRQESLVTRSQCRAAHLSDELVEWRLASRRWVRLHPGVYLTAPGREGWLVDATAAFLRVRATGGLDDGPVVADAALVGGTAAHLWGLTPRAPAVVEVGVPQRRRVSPPAGVSVRRMRRFLPCLDEVSYPWRTTVAATVLDAGAGKDGEAQLALAATAVRQGLVSVARLRGELDARRGHPHGVLLREVSGDLAAGAHSPAEVRYVRDVERAHGLPTGSRQDPGGSGGSRVHDTVYEGFGVVVEVDGRLGHEPWGRRVRDGRRDRLAAGGGLFTTRVFWPDVAVTACRTATEMASVLRARGWTGEPHRCRRPDCVVTPASWGSRPGLGA
ncbi:hypothetical protein ACK8HX_10610 [Oryzobacter sp. R7]|uniref:hypothetical protein n=1 Tax=Oryzobacter faecalis TaxID=3388656 RepID=UPI00398CF6FD